MFEAVVADGPSATIVWLVGDLDADSADAADAALLAASGSDLLVVDMSRTAFCGAHGLRVLLRAHRWARATGGRMLIAGASDHLRRTVKLAGVDGILCLAADADWNARSSCREPDRR